MDAIHNLTVTMGKKMDALMSALSEIKKKQDHLELALEMQQVCPPTPVTEKPRKISARSPTRSTPARTTPWYMSDSFTDHTPVGGVSKVVPTTSSEAAFTPSSTALTIPASKSTSTSLVEAISVITPTASGTTKAASKTSRKKVDDDSELLTVPVDPGVLLKLHYISASRQNFATNVMRKVFTRAERETSNVNGVLGKSQLDVDKVEYIKSVTFKMYPLEQESLWSKCRSAIDEANRRLYRPKKDHVPLL